MRHPEMGPEQEGINERRTMGKSTMKTIWALLLAGSLALALTGCADGSGLDDEGGISRDEGASSGEQAAGDDQEVVVGGFTMEGPNGREISIPEATVSRDAVEEYVSEVRPIVEGTARDLSGVIRPEAQLEDRTLTLFIEVESIERAQAAAREGLEELGRIDPPEDLAPVHERLVGAYEEALPAYEDIVAAFEGDDVGALTAAVQESLPEIEQLVAQARTILQELERAQSQDVPVEGRG
jgi:hypothetical protein